MKDKKKPIVINGEEFEEVGQVDLSGFQDTGVQATQPTDVSSFQAMKDFGTRAIEATEIPASIIKAGLGEKSTMAGQVENIIKHGPEGIKMAPTGEELLKEQGLVSGEGLPSKVAGFGVDVVTDPLSYPIGVTKPIKALVSSIKTKSGRQAAKALSQYISLTKHTKEGVDAEKLGQFLANEDMVKYLNNPDKMLEVLRGPKQVVTKPMAGQVHISKQSMGKGNIAEIAEDLGSHIKSLSQKDKAYLPKDIMVQVSADFGQKYADPISGEVFKSTDKVDKILSGILRKGNETPAIYTLNDLYELKKNLGKQVNSKEFFKGMDESQVLEREVKVALIKRLDNLISDALDGHKIGNYSAKDYYKVQNNRMHHLLQLEGITEAAKDAGLKSTDITQAALEILSTGAIGGVGGAISGGIEGAKYGIAGGAGFSGIRRVHEGVRDTGSAMASRALDIAGKATPALSSAIPQAVRNTVIDYENKPSVEFTPPTQQRQDRSPDAIRAMQPLPLKLQNMRIPRTTQGILQNPKIVLAKLAQEDPEMFDQMNFILQNRPEDLKDILPLAIEMYPHLFEKDRYGRIDNIVPADKVPMVMEEIRKNDSLSPTQKVNKLDLLNRTGEYYDN